MKKLEWKTEKRKVKDLVQLEFNPRKITEENKKKLIASLDKFNLAEIPCINTDNVIIGGNQRVGIMATVGRGEEVIDVRVPNRKLTTKEVKEYALISNTHAGQYDFEILEAHFEEVMFDETMFDIPGLAEWNTLDEKQENLKQFSDSAERFLNSTVRQIMLVYDNDTHRITLEKLKNIGEKYNIKEDNSAVVLKLIEHYEGN